MGLTLKIYRRDPHSKEERLIGEFPLGFTEMPEESYSRAVQEMKINLFVKGKEFSAADNPGSEAYRLLSKELPQELSEYEKIWFEGLTETEGLFTGICAAISECGYDGGNYRFRVN